MKATPPTVTITVELTEAELARIRESLESFQEADKDALEYSMGFSTEQLEEIRVDFETRKVLLAKLNKI